MHCVLFSRLCGLLCLCLSIFLCQVELQLDKIFKHVHSFIRHQKNGIYKGMTTLEFAARLHAVLISVHPFLDGNGRAIAYLSLAIVGLTVDFPIPLLTPERAKLGRFHHMQTQAGTKSKWVAWNGDAIQKLNSPADTIAAYVFGAEEMIRNAPKEMAEPAAWRWVTSIRAAKKLKEVPK